MAASPRAGMRWNVVQVAEHAPGRRLDGAEFLPILRAELPESKGWTVSRETDSPWTLARPAGVETPEQGWKLHVSASVASATEVLRRVLPVLREARAAFKTVATTDVLVALNDGSLGESQVGKFITIYPSSTDAAVRLAAALDSATAGRSGPAVPSDRVLRAGSIVHYRYGSFTGRVTQTPIGLVVPAIRAPDGALVPDRRETVYAPPPWVEDPFRGTELPEERRAPNLVFGGRYLAAALLFWSARGSVYLGIDLQDGSRCVLKRARRGALVEGSGRDAYHRLRREADVLRRIGARRGIPAVRGAFEHDGDLVLALDYIPGVALSAEMDRRRAAIEPYQPDEVVRLGRELARSLAAVHRAGFVFRDLKSGNIMITPEGDPWLVDFELCQRPGEASPYVLGTAGYMSPEHMRWQPPRRQDDVYSLGAVLYLLATGVEPSRLPRWAGPRARPIEALNPAIGDELTAVILRCLSSDPGETLSSMEAVEQALGTIQRPARAAAHGTRTAGAGGASDATVKATMADLARRLGDTLCDAARPDAEGVFWLSRHQFREGMPCRDLGTGSAGSLLALSEIYGAFGDQRHRAYVEDGARWLASSAPIADPPLPGLYVGEAGVGAALLRAGQILDDTALVEAAVERGRLIASLPHRSPDLYNGTAGCLRFHLLLWDETAGPESLAAAQDCGHTLIRAAEDADDGAIRWTIPDGYEGLSGQTQLGYAHGAAGIAGALLDLYDVTGDDEFREAALRAARWLARQAVPVGPRGRGRTWPALEGGAPAAPMWCHGATGIGRFFLHAARANLLPEAAGLAAGAAWSAAHGARWAPPVQCHGLAGSVEFLLDMAQATGDRGYRREALHLGTLLAALGSEGDGMLVWPSEAGTVETPDYLVGYAGVAVCLLRLSDPERLPSQVSRLGFRHSWAAR